MKLKDADWRNNAEMLASDETNGVFSVFMRRNEDLPENFSVGLRYTANDGRPEIILLRCNGKHGAFTGAGDEKHPHWRFHIHKASAIAQDRGFPAEKYATETSEFASYEQAIEFFVKAVNLDPHDVDKHFPNNVQSNLFESLDQ